MRRDGENIVIDFDEAEAGVLGSLTGQLVELLRGRGPAAGSGVAGTGEADPALQRLLPDAYPDDPEASAEFRRFTADDLADRKAESAEAMLQAVGSTTPDTDELTVTLDPPASESWLRTLTDIRLTVASRLGIRSDDDEVPGTEVGAIYSWLGELQWALIEVLDHEDVPEGGGPDAAPAE